MADPILPQTEPLPFAKWMDLEAPDWIYKPGRRSAYEYGAQAELGTKDYGSIYHRTDCQEAEAAGRRDARKAVAKGIVILCPCCAAPFPVYARTPVQEVDREA